MRCNVFSEVTPCTTNSSVHTDVNQITVISGSYMQNVLLRDKKYHESDFLDV